MNLANSARHASLRVSVASAMAAGLFAMGEAHADDKSGAQLPYDPECLTITQSSSATYMIENASCTGQSVLAAIELSGRGIQARCFTKKIRTQISIASEGVAPVVNYQCI